MELLDKQITYILKSLQDIVENEELEFKGAKGVSQVRFGRHIVRLQTLTEVS